jgi:hypothetical protein
MMHGSTFQGTGKSARRKQAITHQAKAILRILGSERMEHTCASQRGALAKVLLRADTNTLSLPT